ncbi:uncharacterized protein LOC142323088 [Lycorma delicatula]|uniref:uncharacterized protein LOC142323088 n=1 Tax=Lycorma delicatula TaxID=130591 RepID=UPI003F50F4CA
MVSSKSENAEDDGEEKKQPSSSLSDKYETENYTKKLHEMQKYIPFLEVMIARIEKAKDKTREGQLVKLKSLYDILSNKKQKLKVDSLEKCELVLKKLYEKVEKGDKVFFPEKCNIQTGDLNKKPTDKSNKSEALSANKERTPCANEDVHSTVLDSDKTNSQVACNSNFKDRKLPFLNNSCEKKSLLSYSQQKQLSGTIEKFSRSETGEKNVTDTSKNIYLWKRKKDILETGTNKKNINWNIVDSPSCSSSGDSNTDIPETLNHPLKTDDFNKSPNWGGRNVQVPEIGKKLHDVCDSQVIQHLSSDNSGCDSPYQHEFNRKQSTFQSDGWQKKPNVPSQSIRAKLAEEIIAVHKVGTSSGGALRVLVNKAENIKQNRILSLKPGTVIDLFNDKPVTSNHSPKGGGDVSLQGKFDSKEVRKSVLESTKGICSQVKGTSGEKSSNVLSHLSPEQLEKLVAENLGTLPSPPPETMLKILETVSAKAKAKQVSSSSHPGVENPVFNQRSLFHSTLGNPLSSPQHTSNTVQVPNCMSPTNLSDNFPSRMNVNVNMNYFRDVPIVHETNMSSQFQGQQPHFGGFSPNSGVGRMPNSGVNYCPSPYPQRNDTIPPLLSQKGPRPLYMPLMPNLPDNSMPSQDQGYFHNPQPSVDYNQGETFAPHNLAQNRHYIPPNKNYMGLSVGQNPNSISFDCTKSLGKSVSERDPRRRSLEKPFDDHIIRDPRHRNSEKSFEDDRRSTMKEESNYGVDILKRNDPRQQRHSASYRDMPKPFSDSRQPIDLQNDGEKRSLSRSRDPRCVGGERKSVDSNSAVDRRNRNSSLDRLLARDRHSYDSDRYKRSNDALQQHRNVMQDKKEESFSSPLESLYAGVSGPKTGRGYGFQSFRIPKKKVKEDAVKLKSKADDILRENETSTTTDQEQIDSSNCDSTESIEYDRTCDNELSEGIVIKGNKIIDVVEKESDTEDSNQTAITDADTTDGNIQNEYKDMYKLTRKSVVADGNCKKDIIKHTKTSEQEVSSSSNDIKIEVKELTKEEKETEIESLQTLDKTIVKETSHSVPLSGSTTAEKIKEEFTQELIETYLRKSLTSGLCKKLLEKLGGAPLKGEKLKKIERIIVSSSSEDEDNSTDIPSKNEDIECSDKKESADEKMTASNQLVKEQIEEDSCDGGTGLMNDTAGNTTESEEEILQSKGQKSCVKKGSKKKQTVKKKNSKKKVTPSKTKSSKVTKNAYVDNLDVEAVETETGSNKPKRKIKNELEKLHEDIRDMFISASVVNATGMRTCRLKPDNYVDNALRKTEIEPLPAGVIGLKSRKKFQTKARKVKNSARYEDEDESDSEEVMDDHNSRAFVGLNKKSHKNAEILKRAAELIDEVSDEENYIEDVGKLKKKPQNVEKKKKSVKQCLNEQEESENETNKDNTFQKKTNKRKKCDLNNDDESVLTAIEDKDASTLKNVESTPKQPEVSVKPGKVLKGMGVECENSDDEFLTVFKKKCLSTKIEEATVTYVKNNDDITSNNSIENAKNSCEVSILSSCETLKSSSEILHTDKKGQLEVITGDCEDLTSRNFSCEDPSGESILNIKPNLSNSETIKKTDPVYENDNDLKSVAQADSQSTDIESTEKGELSVTKDQESSQSLMNSSKTDCTKKCEILISKLTDISCGKTIDPVKLEDSNDMNCQESSVIEGKSYECNTVRSENEQMCESESRKRKGKRKKWSLGYIRKKVKVAEKSSSDSQMHSNMNECAASDDNDVTLMNDVKDITESEIKDGKTVKEKEVMSDISGIEKVEDKSEVKQLFLGARDEQENSAQKNGNITALADVTINYSDKEHFQDVNSKVISCKICDYSGKPVLLVRHYRTDHPEVEVLVSRFSQPVADEAIDQSVSCSFGNEISKKNNKSVYSCRMCSRVCTNIFSFYDHVSSHTGEYRYRCLSCLYEASNRDAIKTHFQKAHWFGQTKKNDYNKLLYTDSISNLKYDVFGFICSECNFVQLRLENVQEHVKKRHNCDGRMEMFIRKINFSSEQSSFVNDSSMKDEVDNSVKFSEVTPSNKPVEENRDTEDNTPVTVSNSSQPLSGTDLEKCLPMDNSDMVDRSVNITAFITSEVEQESDIENVEERVCIMKELADKLKLAGKQVVKQTENLDMLTSKLLISSDSQEDASDDDSNCSIKGAKINFIKMVSDKIKIPTSERNKEAVKKETCFPNNQSIESNISQEIAQKTDVLCFSKPVLEGIEKLGDQISNEIVFTDASLVSKCNITSIIPGNSSKKLIDADTEENKYMASSELALPITTVSNNLLGEDPKENTTENNFFSVDLSNSVEQLKELSSKGSRSKDYESSSSANNSSENKAKSKNTVGLLSIVGRLSETLFTDELTSPSTDDVSGSADSPSKSESSILLNRLKSPVGQHPVKKYKFQDTKTTHIKVGHLSASLVNCTVLFSCNIENCDFNPTANADSFLQHVEKCHENVKFQAMCSACFIRCDKSNESHMVSSFIHLLNSHLMLLTENNSNTTLPSTIPNSSDSELNIVSTGSAEPTKNDKPTFPQQPLLRVRRLSGDKLSSVPVSGGDSSNFSSIPSASSSVTSVVGMESFGVIHEDNSFQNLRIESVISLNPSASVNLDDTDTSGSTLQTIATFKSFTTGEQLSMVRPQNSSSYMFVPSVGNYLPMSKKVIKVASSNKQMQSDQNTNQTCLQMPSFRSQTLISVLSPKKGQSSLVAPTSAPKSTQPDETSSLAKFDGSGVRVISKIPASVIRKVKKYGPQIFRAVKPNDIYNLMLAPRKLRHLFKCMDAVCSFTCDTFKKFEVHLLGHMNAATRKNTNKVLGDWRMCVYCTDTFNTPHDLCQHITEEHSQSLFQCAYCFYRAYCTSNVILHQNINHIAQNIQILKCQPSAQTEDVEKLVPKRADVIRPFECAIPFCKLKSYIPSAFEKHLQEQHALLRMCQICAYCCVKIFKAENVLEHYKIHSLNLYQCVYCIYGTDTEEDMRVHLCTQHPDNVPKGIMRVDKNLHLQEGFDVEESSFSTKLEDLKECNFDDQKLLESCIVTDAADFDEVEEIVMSTPGERSESEGTLDEATGIFKPLNSEIEKAATPIEQNAGLPVNPSDKSLPSNIPVAYLKNDNPCPKNDEVYVTPELQDPLDDEVQIIRVAGINQMKRPNDMSEAVEPPNKKMALNTNAMDQPQDPLYLSAENISLNSSNSSPKIITHENENSFKAADLGPDNLELRLPLIENSATRVKNHIPVVENLFGCGYRGCDFVSPDSDGLKEHFRVCDYQRDATKSVRCIHCNRTFKRVTGLLDHLHSHGVKRFSCSMCPHKDTTEKRAVTHMRDLHNVSTMMTLPVEPLLSNKDIHKFVIYPVDNKGTKISLLDMKGRTKKLSYCINEIDQLPRKEIFTRQIHCNHCSYSTKVRKNMTQHLKCHEKGQSAPSAEQVNPMPCLEKKEMMFDKMINLAGSTHMKTTTKSKVGDLNDQKDIPRYVPDSERYVCHANGCTYVTVDDVMLRHHIKALHSDEIYYRCPHCMNNIISEIPIEKLGSHLKLHDIRLYKCAYCIYHHNQRYLVERHVSEKHPEKRPFVQVVREPESDDIRSGDERETSRNSSSQDLPGSSGSKPWQCNLCKVRTVTEEQIKEHSGSVHGVYCQFKCGLCDYKADAASDISDHFTGVHPSLPMKFVSLYAKEDSTPVNYDNVETNIGGSPNIKGNAAPLWRKDKKRVRHIRGILLDDQAWKPRQNKDFLGNEMLEEEGKFGPFGYPAAGGYYVCPRCNKYKTKNKADMQNHLYRELEYKLWVCGYCRKSDITRYCINRHLAKMHEGKPESVTVLTPNDEVETWVSTVLKRQHFLMKLKDVSFDDSVVRPRASVNVNAGGRSRRSSTVEEDIKVEDISRENAEEFFGIKEEHTMSIPSSPAKFLPSGPPNNKQVFRRVETDKLNTESTDEDSGSLKQPKAKKQMLAKRWICGYCTVTTVQERSMKAHLAKKHSTFLPLMHRLVDSKTLQPVSPGAMTACGGINDSSEDESSDIFECRLCGLMGTMKELYVHNYNAHPHNKQVQVRFKEGRRFECGEVSCDFVTQSLISLREHFKLQHVNKRVHYKMKVVMKPQIADDLSPEDSMPQVQKNRLYHCPTCDFACDEQTEAISHLKIHLLYKCILCDTVFSSPATGRVHLKDVHKVTASGHLKPIMSSDLITECSPPVKVIYTARKSTAMGPRNIVKRQTARKSTTHLPDTWKRNLKLQNYLDTDSLTAQEFSYYGKPRTVENYASLKTSLVLGNQNMNLTVTQFSKIFDINPKLLITDLKYKGFNS